MKMLIRLWEDKHLIHFRLILRKQTVHDGNSLILLLAMTQLTLTQSDMVWLNATCIPGNTNPADRIQPSDTLAYDEIHASICQRMLDHAYRIKAESGSHVIKERLRRRRNAPFELVLCRATLQSDSPSFS